ncbi:unnamed protein product (macronuclear) [Paramecium tetraurelia]|uniref:Malectin domain-containing protein n=1 Tax=Paramecium tetraurelia TaxID=5888 RepID=A0CEJ8_PARTE|nr:uncharacterized protein GSPATT00037653001 [Paramecium tetraurelia]CAK69215.1 unnamed protein product [Paramecium tetraurelia]|eukprot:XP_001436612.1 hypothetical protein (macronuclear) [Paramecium tetraurelia strain d4-2]
MKYRSFNGINYKNDQFFQGSSEFVDYYDEQQSVKVRKTVDQELYMTQRLGLNFFYKLPLNKDSPETQNYILTLYFAELQYQESNARIFEVFFGNKLVIENLDIYETVGMQTAYSIDLSFQKIGQQILYKGEQINGALSKNQELIIRFKAIKSQAAIAGIMLKIGDNEIEIANNETPRNTLKVMDGFKRLSDESLKIIESEVKEKQKDLQKIHAELDDPNNRRGLKKEIKLVEFSIKLLILLSRSPFGIVLASSFFGISLIALFQLFYNDKQKITELSKTKIQKQN